MGYILDVYLSRLKLRNFRNYNDAALALPPGVSIICGPNGAGKSNILEAIQFSLCGQSFRTSRDQEMIQAGADFARLEAGVERAGTLLSRAVSLQASSPPRVDDGGGPRWLPAGSVLCFSPDDLMLVKGSPALRRRFLDDAISRRHSAYRALVLDYQKVLAQRNSFLQRARAGLVRLEDVSPWDRQLGALAVRIHTARREHCRELAPGFKKTWNMISGQNDATGIEYLSQLGDLMMSSCPEEEVAARLRERWSIDLERGATGFGTHRDDVEFLLDGRSLRSYGSQGEQRLCVLALLLGERELSREAGDALPLLLLDDVMSELDPARRRRLMRLLAQPEIDSVAGLYGNTGGGQAIITAADAALLKGSELAQSALYEVADGTLAGTRAGRRV